MGLALARAFLESWPTLIGPLPRGPLALIIALAVGLLGFGLSRRKSLPFAALIPLLIPIFILLSPYTNPLRDWVFVLAGLGGCVVCLLATQTSRPIWLNWAYPVSLAVIVGGLYLRTLAPTVGEADTFEMQVNAIKLGVSHGSGYPLYLLLAKLFSLLPLGGTAAFRINFSAAFFGVTAVLALYAICNQIGASRPASWIASLTFGTCFAFWSRATEAEVYTFHLTFIGLLLWISLINFHKLSYKLYLLAFIFGLSLTNHLTTVLLAPALVIALAPSVWQHLRQIPTATARWQQVGVWLLVCTLLGTLGLSVYLYLPIRWPAVNHGETMTWDLFKHFLTGQEAQGALRLDAWYTDPSRYVIVFTKVVNALGWLQFLLSLCGLLVLMFWYRRLALITAAAWLSYAFFALSFYVPDPDYSSFLLPCYYIQAFWIAVAITICTGIVRGNWPAWTHVTGIALVYCYLILFPALYIASTLPRVDLSDKWAEYRIGQYILSQPLKQGAAILADSQLIAPLYYLQVAEGVRPDLDIIVLSTEDQYRAVLDERVSAGQTVYLGRYLPHLSDSYYLHSVGPLTEVKTEPSALPDSYTKTDATFGQAIALRGFNLEKNSVAIDEPIHLTLYWQAVQPPPGNYLVTLRVVDSKGQQAGGAAEVPVSQLYPTAAWPTNDVVADFHSVSLDPAFEPGIYHLQVSLAPPFSQSALTLPNGETWFTVADLTLTPPESAPNINTPVRLRFSDTWVLGYNAPATVVPGSLFYFTLYSDTPQPTTLQMCIAAACQPVSISSTSGPVGQTEIVLQAPNQIGPAPITIGGAPAECSWWPTLSKSDSCLLTILDVSGSALAPTAVNYNDQIALENLKLETPTASPGQTVIVTANWRALQPMTDDYTVFVHLLGPDGLVHGQVDTWPVQGTRATSSWVASESLPDRFEIRVPDDAPPGPYTIEVGWYLLATLTRLPVLSPDHIAIDDKYVIPGLTIQK